MTVPTPDWALIDPIALAAPLFVVLIIIEMIVVKLMRCGRYEAQDAAASLTMGFGNTIASMLFGGIAVGAFTLAYQARLFDIPWAWWSLALCFFAEDLAYYWFHRLSHERRWFWASHVVHHTSQHYNLTTALRQTWTGHLSLAFIFWVPLVLIGFPPLMVVLFSGISLIYQFWIHTEMIKRLGLFEWILNTPSHHRVHHATNPRYLDANYAGVLIIWDRLFGTFVPEDDKDPPRYGVIDNLGTFNPLRIAFHEWAVILKDVRSSRNLKHMIGYLFGPPGWSPDGSRLTTRAIKANAGVIQAGKA